MKSFKDVKELLDESREPVSLTFEQYKNIKEKEKDFIIKKKGYKKRVWAKAKINKDVYYLKKEKNSIKIYEENMIQVLKINGENRYREKGSWYTEKGGKILDKDLLQKYLKENNVEGELYISKDFYEILKEKNVLDIENKIENSEQNWEFIKFGEERLKVLKNIDNDKNSVKIVKEIIVAEVENEIYELRKGMWLNKENVIAPGAVVMEINKRLRERISNDTIIRNSPDIENVKRIINLNSSNNEKFYLDVPKLESEIAKERGARWDKNESLWYIKKEMIKETKNMIEARDIFGEKKEVKIKRNILDDLSRYCRSINDLEKVYFKIGKDEIEQAKLLGGRIKQREIYLYNVEKEKIELFKKNWEIKEDIKKLNRIDLNEFKEVMEDARAGKRYSSNNPRYPGLVILKEVEYRDLKNSGKLKNIKDNYFELDSLYGKGKINENKEFEFMQKNYETKVEYYLEMLKEKLKGSVEILNNQKIIDLRELSDKQIQRISESLIENDIKVKIENIDMRRKNVFSIGI